MPALDKIPPQQPQPFVEASLGPLAVLPPVRPELRLVPSHSHRERLSRNLVAKDTQGTARVKLRGDEQYPVTGFAGQAFFSVVRFIPGGEALNRANLKRCSLR